MKIEAKTKLDKKSFEKKKNLLKNTRKMRTKMKMNLFELYFSVALVDYLMTLLVFKAFVARSFYKFEEFFI